MEVGYLKWLRYTMFIPLYPLGVASELALVWIALPAIRDIHLWSLAMPNAFNFAFDYPTYVMIYSSLYLPCTPNPHHLFNILCLSSFPSTVWIHAGTEEEGPGIQEQNRLAA